MQSFSRVRGIGSLAPALLLALLSSLLAVISLPPTDWGWLAWVCLVPLALAVREMTMGRAFLLGWLYGTVAILCICRWIFNVPGFGFRHALPLAASVGLFSAVWCLVASRPFRSPGLRIASLASLWILLDFGKANFGFLSFPWAPLAWSQHANIPLLQLASVTGEYGVTLVVVAANLAIVETIATKRWRPLAAVAVVLFAVHLWGFFNVGGNPDAPTFRVASVQPCIPKGAGWLSTDGEKVLATLRALTKQAAAASPALVIWPESSIRKFPVQDTVYGPVASLCRETGIALVAGVAEMDKSSAPSADGKSMEITRTTRNDAVFILPDGSVAGRYSKRILLPFSEYLPLQPMVAWPDWLVPLSPKGEARGNGPALFAIPGGVSVSPFICWESIFPAFIRESVALSPRLLVQLSNEIHWGRSAGGTQHNLASVLRAVEHRKAVVVSSNTGPTLVVDPWGRVVASNERLFEPAVVIADVPLGGGPTPYTRFGDWILLPSFIAFAFGLARSGGRRDILSESRQMS